MYVVLDFFFFLMFPRVGFNSWAQTILLPPPSEELGIHTLHSTTLGSYMVLVL
jgi:hypothetical protein